jgi:hypothetical protein
MDRPLDSQNTDSQSNRRTNEPHADEVRENELRDEELEAQVLSSEDDITDDDSYDDSEDGELEEEDAAAEIPRRPHLITAQELRAAGALDVPPSWRTSLGPTKIERDLFSDLVDD